MFMGLMLGFVIGELTCLSILGFRNKMLRRSAAEGTPIRVQGKVYYVREGTVDEE